MHCLEVTVLKFPDLEFTDLHTHILPDTDDGPEDLAQALDMLQLAWDSGTRRIFLTPHHRGPWQYTPDELRQRVRELQEAAKDRFPGLELYLGCEITYFHESPELLREKKLLTMADSPYVLVEFSPAVSRTALVAGLESLLEAGFYPILAHSERYGIMKPELARELNRKGVLLQLNADSVLGAQGFRVKWLCKKLLNQLLVFCIASDAHDSAHRPPTLRKAFLAVAKKYGPDYARAMFDQNPRFILE